MGVYLGQESGPFDGTCDPQEEMRKTSSLPRRGQSEKASDYKPEEGPHPEPKLSAFLTRTV